jgi:hypothetical protein
VTLIEFALRGGTGGEGQEMLQ